jgi:hypothetical protein
MSLRILDFLGRYDVPAEELWSVVIDHEGMGDWLDAKVSVIAGPGDGGLGTVRRIATGPLRIDEEVIACDPPERYLYRIIRGLPLRYHQGEVRVVAVGDGQSELHWTITVGSGVPGFAEAVALTLKPAINRGLRKLPGLLSARRARAASSSSGG